MQIHLAILEFLMRTDWQGEANRRIFTMFLKMNFWNKDQIVKKQSHTRNK
jgi:hypothetical protein